MPDPGNHNNGELQALIRLLDEPNTHMFVKIEKKILTYGLEAVPLLENTWDNCFDDLVQERIEILLHKIQFENTYDEFCLWACSNTPKLIDGYFLISRYLYPDLDKDDLVKSINIIKNDIRLELNENLTALEKVKVINHVIFDIHKFKADRRSTRTVQNHMLNNLLETKKGSNLSLAILYLIVIEAHNLPIFGVDLPRHFILAYSGKNTNTSELCSSDDILFYINPFTGGSILTKKEVELFMKQVDIVSIPAFYRPWDELTIIKRLMNELLAHYKNHGFIDRVRELEHLLNCLPK